VVGAALFQIPNQPIYFSDEHPPNGRGEDAMVAWTWKHFMDDPSNPEWLARLPMTKAAVRALDTLAAYRAPQQTITRFGIAGASKRGWTTWTTAAVDKRIYAALPVVMDELNFVKNIHHHYRAYGGWSFALKDYYDLNFTMYLDEPVVQQIMDIVDPYSYLDRYAGMPKMVIDAGGDEFFLPDDEYYWWNDMPEPKRFLSVPNAEHSLATGILEVLPAVTAFIGGVLANDQIPEMFWSIDYNNTGDITVNVPAANPQPVNVTLYGADSAPNTGRRDFRLIGGFPNPTLQWCLWGSATLEPTSTGTWIGSMAQPATGWSALMVHMQFQGPRTFSGWQPDYEFSTQISIIPNTFPFPPCTGVGCYGHLL